MWSRLQSYTAVHESNSQALLSALHAYKAAAPGRPCPYPSYGSARLCPHPIPPPGWPSVLARRCSLCVCFCSFVLLFSSIFNTVAAYTRHMCACVRTAPRDGKTECCGCFFFVLLHSPQSSDSDRGPPMRGVDSRGGGFSGNSGNPPPAGGRGRGMVLPAWLVAQQNAQTAGPVSFFFLLLQQPGQAVRWLTTEVNEPSCYCGRDNERMSERSVCLCGACDQPGKVSTSQVRAFVRNGEWRKEHAGLRGVLVTAVTAFCGVLCA